MRSETTRSGTLPSRSWASFWQSNPSTYRRDDTNRLTLGSIRVGRRLRHGGVGARCLGGGLGNHLRAGLGGGGGGAQGLALERAGGLGRVALAGAAHGRRGPGAEVRLQLALGRPVDRRRAGLAGYLDRLLVFEEVAAGLAAALGGTDLAPALLLFATLLL